MYVIIKNTYYIRLFFVKKRVFCKNELCMDKIHTNSNNMAIIIVIIMINIKQYNNNYYYYYY